MYHGLCRSTLLPPQPVEIFPLPPLEVKKGIVGRVLKFAGYMHYHKSLPGILLASFKKNKMAAKYFLTSVRSFVGSLEQMVL